MEEDNINKNVMRSTWINYL